MARVTVEDCLRNVKNRFELVILAAKRARQLMHGKEPMVDWDNDKATVVALREIAQGHTDFSHDEPRDEEPVLRFQAPVQPKLQAVSEETDQENEIEEEADPIELDQDSNQHSEDQLGQTTQPINPNEE